MFHFLVDIGNTHVVLGIYSHKGEKLSSWRLRTNIHNTEEEYFFKIKSLLDYKKIEIEQLSKIAISSVVPLLTKTFLLMFEKYFKATKITNVKANLNLGLQYPSKEISHIGADLLVNAFSAKEKYKENCIICDFGTATTINLVGKNGYFYGGVIIPGIISSAENLFSKASQIVSVNLDIPKTLLSISTKDALLSGIVKGASLMLDGFVEILKKIILI